MSFAPLDDSLRDDIGSFEMHEMSNIGNDLAGERPEEESLLTTPCRC